MSEKETLTVSKSHRGEIKSKQCSEFDAEKRRVRGQTVSLFRWWWCWINDAEVMKTKLYVNDRYFTDREQSEWQTPTLTLAEVFFYSNQCSAHALERIAGF